MFLMNINELDYDFYKNVAPIKLTEGRVVKLLTEGWSLLTEYFLESVKINNTRAGITTSATLRVCDTLGQVTCLIKGPIVGLLFGLTVTEWTEVEKLCGQGQQLFYRYFKNGISKSFCYEQKLFYNFCLTSQKNDVLVAKFKRTPNTRNKFRTDAFLEILALHKCDNIVMDIYCNGLRIQSDIT